MLFKVSNDSNKILNLIVVKVKYFAKLLKLVKLQKNLFRKKCEFYAFLLKHLRKCYFFLVLVIDLLSIILSIHVVLLSILHLKGLWLLLTVVKSVWLIILLYKVLVSKNNVLWLVCSIKWIGALDHLSCNLWLGLNWKSVHLGELVMLLVLSHMLSNVFGVWFLQL